MSGCESEAEGPPHFDRSQPFLKLQSCIGASEDTVQGNPSLPRKTFCSLEGSKMGSASGYNPKTFTKIYLNGEYVASKAKETFSLKNPKDNSVVVEGIPISGPEDVDLAVKYAEEAYEGPWSKFTAMEKTQCFYKLATLLEDHLVDILTLDSLSSGNPVSIIPTREKNYIKNCVLYYAGWTDKQKGDYFPADDGNVASGFFYWCV